MKIFVLHCGGTISCESKNGVLSPSADIVPQFKRLASEFPSVTFSHKRITPFLSEYLSGAQLNTITKEVKKAADSDKYSGIIVCHGSDTVFYTAAAIGYTLGLNSIPTVTVCADLPLSNERSSGHESLRAAVAVIVSGKARGALAVYPSGSEVTVHRATRLLRHKTYENGLTSVGQPYGKVVTISPVNRIFIKNDDYSELRDELSPFTQSFKRRCPIMHLTVTPGMPYPHPPLLCRAVILGSYHSGTVDTQSRETVRFANECRRRGIPVYVDGTGGCADYESTVRFAELGFTRLPALTSPQAMYIKLWLTHSAALTTNTSEILRLSLSGDLPASI